MWQFLKSFHIRTEKRKIDSHDALRVALVWKCGGLYSDLDVIVLKSLKQFRNVMGAAKDLDFGTVWRSVASGEFHFEARNIILLSLMENMRNVYVVDSDRGVLGPLLFTGTFQEVYKQDDKAWLNFKGLLYFQRVLYLIDTFLFGLFLFIGIYAVI